MIKSTKTKTSAFSCFVIKIKPILYCMLLLLLSLHVISCGNFKEENSANPKEEIKSQNNTEKLVAVDSKDSILSVTLPDSTKVLLNRGTTLSYPEEFKGEEREVTIKGEAYFEVTKSASKKFNVYAGNTKITVLGTSFNVNAPEDAENTEITVIEGEVEVMDKNNKEEKIRLKKDEQVVFNRKNKNFSKRKVDGSKFKFWFKTRLGKIKKLLKKLGKE